MHTCAKRNEFTEVYQNLARHRSKNNFELSK